MVISENLPQNTWRSREADTNAESYNTDRKWNLRKTSRKSRSTRCAIDSKLTMPGIMLRKYAASDRSMRR